MESTYRRLRTPSGTAVCVSTRGNPAKVTIAVGDRQRINCDTDEAHAVWRTLTTTLFANGGRAPSWAVQVPETSHDPIGARPRSSVTASP